MPVFHPLRVTDVRRETTDTVSVALEVPLRDLTDVGDKSSTVPT